MNGSKLLTYINELCRDMDAGRPLKRFDWRKAAATAAVPLVLGLGGLGCNASSCVAPEPADLYGTPSPHQTAPTDTPSTSDSGPVASPSPPPQEVAPAPVEAYGVQDVPEQQPPVQVAPPAVGAYGAPPASNSNPNELN